MPLISERVLCCQQACALLVTRDHGAHAGKHEAAPQGPIGLITRFPDCLIGNYKNNIVRAARQSLFYSPKADWGHLAVEEVTGGGTRGYQRPGLPRSTEQEGRGRATQLASQERTTRSLFLVPPTTTKRPGQQGQKEAFLPTHGCPKLLAARYFLLYSLWLRWSGSKGQSDGPVRTKRSPGTTAWRRRMAKLGEAPL